MEAAGRHGAQQGRPLTVALPSGATATVVFVPDSHAAASAAARSVALYRDHDAPQGLAASVTEKPDYARSRIPMEAV